MPHLSRLRFIDVDRTRLPVRRRIRSRGVPNALQEHPVACTTDPALATRVTSQLLGPAAVAPVRGGRRDFQCTLNAIQFLDVTMAYLDYAVATDVAVAEAADAYTVHMTTSGQASARVGGEDHLITAFLALVVSPGTEYVLHLEHDSPQLIIRIERAAMERQLSRMLGRSLDGPVVFEPVGDLTTDAASRWHGALNILSAEVMSGSSLIQQGVGATALEELIISTLLYIQPHSYSSSLVARPRRSGRAAVRRSLEYIERHLAEPISLDDLASYARMSPRSIQAGFREDLDTTPIAYIRDRRLDRVRQTLMSAMPEDGVNVTDAAQRWGFTHLGNFSGVYRRRFGESPSQTLRRQATRQEPAGA
ncbi:AraC family transcriptional regulator [Nocardioides sp. YIM 152588]|uniref:AraC family transcriptional regulator n=1 Tax=Nocardioides sp. YIM 152588 TaxID=3158259 RepID=UPI0032E42DBA